MPSNEQIQDVIASALALPAEQRLEVMDAIHVSLADPSIDHGPEEPADVLQQSGKMKLLVASLIWTMVA